MANVTITLDEDLLRRARAEAEAAGKSLSRWLADLVAAEEARLRAERVAAMEGFVALARAVKLEGDPYRFDREEIYDEAVSRFEHRDLQPRSTRARQAGALPAVAERGGGAKFAHDQPAGVRRKPERGGAKTRPKA
jgi:hypothetical protein